MAPVSTDGRLQPPNGCFRRCKRRAHRQGGRDAARLPVCRHLPTALEHARRQPGPVGALADAFAVIEPQLNWKIRAGAETQGEQFLNSHANATITGPEGLEIRRRCSDRREPYGAAHAISRPPSSARGDLYRACRAGNGARRAIHGTSRASAAWSTIHRTSCTRCARRNGHCSRFGSFGRNGAAADLEGQAATTCITLPCVRHRRTD